jgi:hypothetical protein
MDPATHEVRVTFAWWVDVYIWLLVNFCLLMKTEPDYQKVAAFIMRGAKAQVVPIEESPTDEKR